MKKILFLSALLISSTYATSSMAQTWGLEKNVQARQKGTDQKPQSGNSYKGSPGAATDRTWDLEKNVQGRQKRTGRNPQTGAEIKTK